MMLILRTDRDISNFYQNRQGINFFARVTVHGDLAGLHRFSPWVASHIRYDAGRKAP